MTPTESLLKELEKDICGDKECRACGHLPALLRMFREQREALESVASINCDDHFNHVKKNFWISRMRISESDVADVLVQDVKVCREAISRCDEIAKGVKG